MKFRYNPPDVIKKMFSSFQWESKTDKVLLTFDDGPIPETTPLILDTLSGYNIKAAFFCVGENIQRYPDLCRDLIKEGHLVCNHTFNHKPLTNLNRNDAAGQIERFNNLIKSDFNGDVLYFRPPHGRFNFSTPSLMKEMHLTNVMWSLLTYDFRNDLTIVKFAVNKYLEKNSVVVLHDSLKSKDIIGESIRYIVDESSRKGFQIGAPSECLR
jgi:peptidoglycan-N-acetylglucosamine deacetylase